jgi:glycine/D-amino acid oxidase-like deaminating enzyme
MRELGPGSGGMQRIVVLGAGFAGLWSVIGAARKLDELGIGPDRVEVTLVDRSAFHSIRVRNYEAALADHANSPRRRLRRSESPASSRASARRCWRIWFMIPIAGSC